MTAPTLQPTIADGFAHLDLELADLSMRQLADQGLRNEPSRAWWWSAAVALTSRALSAGHVCLNIASDVDSVGLHNSSPGCLGFDLLAPADPSRMGEFCAFIQSFLQHPLTKLCAGESPPNTAQAPHQGPAAYPAQASGLVTVDSGRLYLRRQWATECRVAAALAQRAGLRVPLSAANAARAQTLLGTWFPSPEAPTSHDQRLACLQAAQSLLTIITGGPGTGKTYTAARLIALLQALRPSGSRSLRMALAAPTGKAAARLRQALEQAWTDLRGRGLPDPLQDEFWDESWQSIEGPHTVHSLLAQWRRDVRSAPLLVNPMAPGAQPLNPLDDAVDLLLVDEASMLDLGLMDELLVLLPAHARLVLIGDRDQLASVEAGAVMADICAALGSHPAMTSLRHSRRFQGTIGAWARGVQVQDPAILRDIRAEASPDRTALIGLAAGPRGWALFMEQAAALVGTPQALATDEALRLLLRSLDKFRVLAALRLGPWGVEELNTAIESRLAASGLFRPADPWPQGRVLMVTRNDDSTGLRNGDVGMVLPAACGASAQFAWLAGHDVLRVGVSRLPPVELAYAMTIHKSQGSEFDHVALVLPHVDSPVLSRELLYTGLTRAKSQVSWFAPAPELLEAAAARCTRRMSGLAPRLRRLVQGPA